MSGGHTTAPWTMAEAARALRAGELSSEELTRAVLARADALSDGLGTYLARFDDTALAAARRADEELADGVDRGPLHGKPVGVKDILATVEGPTTAQSLALDPAWGRGRDAPVVARLRAAGAVITGKLSTMEFAIGMPDPAKPFPLPRNPWDVDRRAGGSSSGSGNGVASGQCLMAIGTDTGGSIRIPAAHCGVTGLKPTFGRVPKSGCVPLGFTLDHIGPLARTAEDCASSLAAIAGPDASDPYCADRPVPADLTRLDGPLDGLRVGVVDAGHFPPISDARLRACFDAACATLAHQGVELREVALPWCQEALIAAWVTLSAEAFAYHRTNLAERWEDYTPGTKHWLVPGALLSAADFVQAQRVRRRVRQDVARLFQDVDLVVAPTSVTAAPRYDDLLGAPPDAGTALTTLFTPYWNLTGHPVLALPIGFNDTGLPLSMQIVGRPFDERTVLRAGHAYQQATDWHRRVPPVLEGAR